MLSAVVSFEAERWVSCNATNEHGFREHGHASAAHGCVQQMLARQKCAKMCRRWWATRARLINKSSGDILPSWRWWCAADLKRAARAARLRSVHATAIYASKQLAFKPAIFFSMLDGLASGSRSANRSIHAELFLSALDLPDTLFLLLGSSALEAPWIRFNMSNARLDVVGPAVFDVLAALLAPHAAPLNISNKQSDSDGSSSAMSSKSNRSVSIGCFAAGFDILSLDRCAAGAVLFAPVDVAPAHCFVSSSKSSWKRKTHCGWFESDFLQ